MSSMATMAPAASIPACRHPPPNRCRCARASSMTSVRPQSNEPTGAPSPFETQNITVSGGPASACTDVLSATAALKRRAPSQCSGSACAAAAHARSATSLAGHGRPLAGMCVFSIVTREIGGK